MNMSFSTDRVRRFHPHKVALWLGMMSMVMFFAAFTSAFIVRRDGDSSFWRDFEVPMPFFVSTGLILAASVALHGALGAYRKEEARLYRGLLMAALALGIGFLVSQYQGWQTLSAVEIKVQGGGPAESFFYLITYLHFAHVLGGIAALSLAVAQSFWLPFRFTEKRELRLELTATYWHFVDVLWIYLFVFLLTQG
jgi:cytochrome c oxidase subunit 3